MRTVTLQVSGVKKQVRYEKVNGQLWLHVDGETFCFETVRRKGRGSGRGSKSEPGKIRAQMPGKILKLMVEQGAKVDVGQPLVAMEAMKMEYVLKADLAGVVEAIGCSIGDQVSLGQLLVQLAGKE